MPTTQRRLLDFGAIAQQASSELGASALRGQGASSRSRIDFGAIAQQASSELAAANAQNQGQDRRSTRRLEERETTPRSQGGGSRLQDLLAASNAQTQGQGRHVQQLGSRGNNNGVLGRR